MGVNLRRPPTNGETSAALLDLLATGVATIVTDVATFADYPDTVVRKVHWDEPGPGGAAPGPLVAGHRPHRAPGIRQRGPGLRPPASRLAGFGERLMSS